MRGEVIQSRQDSFQIDYKGEQVNLTSEDVEEGRAKFIAPRIKRKKLKPWIIGERSDVPQTTKSPIIKQANLLKASDTLASLQGDGRFCPVRFFLWHFCPLDYHILRQFYPPEIREAYQRLAMNQTNVLPTRRNA